VGYGFVVGVVDGFGGLSKLHSFQEFDSREAAEESVAKYNEGFFMGNKIRVEISRGGGRFAKFSGDPGACFKCGQMGHWARSA
jgi:Zinc knuckle